MSVPTDRLIAAIDWLTRNRLDPSKGEYLANFLWHREHEQDAERDRYRRALERIQRGDWITCTPVDGVHGPDCIMAIAAEALREPTP